jgi:hypothetical protein
MRRRVLIPALIAVLAVAWGASSSAETLQIENIRVTFSANFTPHVLPRLRPAPVNIAIHGKVATTDGSHPPPLRWIEIKLNRNGHLYSKGLPVCAAPALQSTSTETALARCGGARVGSGRFRAEVTLGRPIPVAGKIFAFNSRRNGKPALLLHLFAGAPVRFTLVVPLIIGHQRDGEFGTILRARIPKLGGDLGSVTEIDLTIGRRYSFGDRRRSYVSAACSIPPGIDSTLFPFARGTFRFEAHREFSETLLRGCRVAGS